MRWGFQVIVSIVGLNQFGIHFFFLENSQLVALIKYLRLGKSTKIPKNLVESTNGIRKNPCLLNVKSNAFVLFLLLENRLLN
jgi:hypothetical protein